MVKDFECIQRFITVRNSQYEYFLKNILVTYISNFLLNSPPTCISLLAPCYNRHIHFYSPTLPFSISMSIRSTLTPMKLVKHADGMVQSAEVLFRNHQSIMRGDDQILAEDWILR